MRAFKGGRLEADRYSKQSLVRNPEMSVRICHVVGARPNYMKAAPVVRALSKYSGVEQTVIHTGQHYDVSMSDVFFQQLGMPEPDFNLRVGSGTHAQQTATIIGRFEPVVLELRPHVVVVYGDVNSTIAAALVCSKLGVPVAHVEAGLRSFDRTMPEEINRLLTDQICSLLFTPSEDGDANLAREGVAPANVHLVGNVMIDTLVRMLPKSREYMPTSPKRFALVTLHRPSNVDDIEWLGAMLETLNQIGGETPVLFPVHPRTRKGLNQVLTNTGANGHIQLMDPLPYLEFLALQQAAEVVITDSGGIQEETTFLGIPCLTVRENTERPVTVELGTNVLVGRDLDRLRYEAEHVLSGHKKKGRIPPLWDGHAAERIAEVVIRKYTESAETAVIEATQAAR
jgi:UDP-N-acetylglucosamine 2-epimerase (non-hydrolysing)